MNTNFICNCLLQLDLDRAKFLVTQAFEEDESGNGKDAIDLYTEAVELLLSLVNTTNQWIMNMK